MTAVCQLDSPCGPLYGDVVGVDGPVDVPVGVHECEALEGLACEGDDVPLLERVERQEDFRQAAPVYSLFDEISIDKAQPGHVVVLEDDPLAVAAESVRGQRRGGARSEGEGRI